MSLAFSLIEICDLLKALRLFPALGGKVFFLVLLNAKLGEAKVWGSQVPSSDCSHFTGRRTHICD